MPLNRYIVRVDPNGKSMAVDILDTSGTSVTAYESSEFAAATRTLPLTITETTDFHLTVPGPHDVSCKVGTTEVADNGSPQRVQAGSVPVLVAPEWEVELAGSGSAASSAPVVVGIASSRPGAAAVSTIGVDLATVKPVVTLLDGMGSGSGSVGVSAVTAGGTILAGGYTVTGTASFIGHPMHAIYRSVDGGQSWAGCSSPLDADLANNYCSSLVHANGLTWYATGPTGILKSIDDGQTWTAVTTTLPGAAVNCIAYDGVYFYVTVPADAAGHSGLYRSADFSSWTELAVTTPQPAANCVATPSALMVWTTSGGDVTGWCLRVSHDHGATFVTPPHDADGDPYYPYFVTTDGDGHWIAWVAAGNGAFNGYVQSLDDGLTWSTDNIVRMPFGAFGPVVHLPAVGWVTTWGPSVQSPVGSTAGGGYIVYTAPVAEPLVWTPTGYAASNVQPPCALVAV